MNAFSDPEIEEVIGMLSSQTGKTEIINNVTGYYIDQDPAPILAVHPTLDIAKAWSKDRLTPMLRDTPVLQGKVHNARSTDKTNTILHKVFPSGHITMAGSNSAASLAGRPIRIVLQDEIDRYKASAGSEGSPMDLADKRATTFWNRKKGKFSTPTIEGRSNITAAYEESDRRKYHVPCPHCGLHQIMKWAQVKWPKGKPERAHYECIFCQAHITDIDKIQMIRDGEWRAEKETKGIAGFWINELYSPWVSFGNMAVRFTKAKKMAKRGDTEALKVFINTSLAETWKEGTQNVDDNQLYSRRENYGPELPNGVMVLVVAVDVQADRLEAELKGFGYQEEEWKIEYKVFPGDPSFTPVWEDLDEYLQKTWIHKQGIRMIIAGCAIDSGYKTDEVYKFVENRQRRSIHGFEQRVIAIKGAKDASAPLVPVRVTKKGPVHLYNLGVNQGKDLINTRLQVEEPGPGYIHFPAEYDEEYFVQLTNEYCKEIKGERRWVPRREGLKVEALDISVYGIAALRIAAFRNLKPNWEKMLLQHEQRIEKAKEGFPVEQSETTKPAGRRVISGGIKKGRRYKLRERDR